MPCAKCNHDNPPDALFCMKCGAKVEIGCSSCGTANPADANFCRKCGKALEAGAPASLPTPAAAAKTPRVEVTPERQTAEGLDSERKTVTALFADIKGSMELMRGPRSGGGARDRRSRPQADDRRGASLRWLRRAIDRRRHLRVVRRAGRARRPSAARAVRGAADAGGPASATRASCARRGVAPIEIRVGLNTGEVVVRSIQTGEASHRVHADRAFDQPGVADADARADRLDRDQRAYAQTGRGLLRISSRWDRPGSRA